MTVSCVIFGIRICCHLQVPWIVEKEEVFISMSKSCYTDLSGPSS